MKKTYRVFLAIFTFFGIVAIFLIRLSQPPSIKVMPLEKNSWRGIIKYERVSNLSEPQRREIYEQVVHQMSISVVPDTAYIIIARKNKLSVEAVKNIIGEGLASNWEDTIDQ